MEMGRTIKRAMCETTINFNHVVYALFFLSLSQNPILRRLLLTALFTTSLFAASLLTTLFAASFLAALFVASTFDLATSSSRQARKRTLPLLVPVDDVEQASEDEQFQWTVGEKAVVPEEGTESHELTKVVVSGMPYSATEKQIRDLFKDIGPVAQLQLSRFPDSGNFRGLAFVTFQGHFDDVERAPILPSKPPKETKEMEEYAQKTSLAPALLSASDKLKIEATMLFKKISLKLDVLSHFHFAPKSVIEDMSIQVNVPALAMEEVAPLAVSDAAMLAPEEIFHGKGNIKEEAELTKEERKRRWANQKRRFR
ncbi:hypothetical protein ZIOFF_065037 [Zingiber officinale]|uniref:RRM domain-containing protein n=1 Tax=Zingiber officinale TaxID=94328 RepID=A0A8J5F108_ZINOF|nr:hypothetical protein ZIOFF_065037 [Zingiber officinale]